MLKQWKQAISKLEKALELKRVIFQENPKEVAKTICLLASALLKNEEYKKALSYSQEALEIFNACHSADDAIDCIVDIAKCYKGLKNRSRAFATFRIIEGLCARDTAVSNERREWVHEVLADIFMEEEYSDKPKALHHLKEAEAILRRIKQSIEDEKDLRELQAKIVNLEIT